MNIEELLTKSEGKTLEFKRKLASKGIMRTVVLFANTAGGISALKQREMDRLPIVNSP